MAFWIFCSHKVFQYLQLERRYKMIWTKQVKGYAKKINEDVIHIDEDNENLFVGIADGQSQKKYSIEGGLMSLVKVSGFFKTHSLEELNQRYEDEIQLELIKPIREMLHGFAKCKNTDIEELSSTLCTITVEKQTGRFMTLNLGNGLILGVTSDSKIRILSNREQGIQRESTYLTTTRNLSSHIRLGWGKINDYKMFILITDGMKVLHGGFVANKMARMFIEENYSELEKEIEEKMYEDDATIVIIRP